jgi:hypothetical protein
MLGGPEILPTCSADLGLFELFHLKFNESLPTLPLWVQMKSFYYQASPFNDKHYFRQPLAMPLS